MGDDLEGGVRAVGGGGGFDKVADGGGGGTVPADEGFHVGLGDEQFAPEHSGGGLDDADFGAVGLVKEAGGEVLEEVVELLGEGLDFLGGGDGFGGGFGGGFGDLRVPIDDFVFGGAFDPAGDIDFLVDEFMDGGEGGFEVPVEDLLVAEFAEGVGDFEFLDVLVEKGHEVPFHDLHVADLFEGVFDFGDSFWHGGGGGESGAAE